MFTIGEIIAHPLYGAGTIIEKNNREVLGEIHEYYVIEMSGKNEVIMVPVNKMHELGIRALMPIGEAEKIMELLICPVELGNDNWNKRYRDNNDKLKTGDIYEVTEVVRELTVRDNCKGLSAREKKMLLNAKKIILSELACVMGATYEVLDQQVKEAIEQVV